MTQRNTFPRLLLTLILLTVVCAGLFAPSSLIVEAKPLSACPGGVITEWTFLGDVTTPSTGSGVFANGVGLTPTTAPYTFFAGNPDRAISFSGWALAFDANDYVEFAVDTTARSDVRFSFDYRSTGTGPTTLDLQYSTDGTSFTSFTTVLLTRDSTFYSLSYDLSSITGINNNINTKIRLYGYGATGGNLRLDNVTIFELCPTPTPTNTFTPTHTFTTTNTLAFSLTPSLTPAPGEVIVSEVAWSGTIATTNDEWIELYNTRSTPIDITGWRLVSDSGSVDIVLNGVINGNSFFLLERARELTVSDVTANQIYIGALSDAGEILRLSKPNGVVIDTANSDGGSWPAGTASSTFYSMERLVNGSVVAADTSNGWVSNNQPISWLTHDADNNLVHGTPGLPNFNFVSTLTPTSTITATQTRTVTPTSSPTRSVIINEIAWAGTTSGLSDDEWIELYNPGSTSINITGWRITASDGTPNITLVGTIPANGYFLLEKDDDNTVRDILADQIYTGNAMSNSGESLTVYDASNKIIDRANSNGGSWPAGSSSTYGTMERISGTADSDSAWHTNTGAKRNGKNANNGNILGTPKNGNSPGPTPTPSRTNTPTRTPTPFPIDARAVINEILARPGFDWNQDGAVNVFDEFIEIKNLSPIDITLNGWRLDKNNGEVTFALPNVTLKPNERIVLYSLETNLLLSDGGETIRLFNPSGKIYDAYTYTVAKEEDESFCRLPDGNVYGGWFEDCVPTPNLTNTREGVVPVSPNENESSTCNLPDTTPADFFFAECNGYGKNIWNPFYWGELYRMFIESNTTKWETFIE